MPPRILIADDHAIVREGLKVLLERKGLEVPWMAENGRQAVCFAEKFKPEIVIMDVTMPEMNGSIATEKIMQALPQTRVIALSMHSDRRCVDRMFNAGAMAYVLKDCAFAELHDAIQTVDRGNYYISPSIAATVADICTPDPGNRQKPPSSRITPREGEVLQLIAEGVKTRQIAHRLFVSIKTVESHRRSIMNKLRIDSVAGLTRFAIQEGLVPPKKPSDV
jgi:DNA-binding NarL/FixJ family response regulator